MNIENIFIGPLLSRRIAVLHLPSENQNEILSYFKKRATFTVNNEIKNIKSFFKLLEQYRNKDDILFFPQHDNIIKKSNNSPYVDILKLLSDTPYSYSNPVFFEKDNVIWDLNYDKYKIEGFTEYSGRIIFTTMLDPESIYEKIVSRHCFCDSEYLKSLAVLEETIVEKKII